MPLPRISQIADIALLFLLCVGVYTFLIFNVGTDIQEHINHIEQINEGTKSYPPNFAFYLIVNALSGFSSNQAVEFVITIILLSLATVAKYVISKYVILELNRTFFKNQGIKKLILIAMALAFCFSIPDPYSVLVLKKFYLGRFVPHVWHNSTITLLFPFAILLFWKQLRVIKAPSNVSMRDTVLLSVLVITNLIIKPSFIFVYLPVTFFFLVIRLRNVSGKVLLMNLIPLFTGALVVFIQYFLIYQMELGSFHKADSSVALGAPFEVMSLWIPVWLIPISLVLSFLLPIFTVVYYKDILKYGPFQYALALSVLGIIIGAFVIESGPRLYHGNFMWQNVICTHLLFLTTLSYLSPKILNKSSWTRKEFILTGLLVLHVFSGLLYLVKIGLTYSYN